MKKIIFFLGIFIGMLTAEKTMGQQTQYQCDLLEIHGDTLITCLSPSPCVTLTSSVMEGVLNETTSYRILQGVPCPPPPVTGGTPTNIYTDDDWSSVITLPFTFYYFGQAFNQLIIGDNGVVSFETNIPGQTAGGYCEWSYNDPAPSTNLFKNTIFGAYHDLLISAGGQIVYYVSGTYPERKFVVDFRNVAHFSCTNLHTSQRIIIHETSNVIDVEIIDKPVCSSWNNGNALIAIQNQNGTGAYVPPGRNTGAWGAANESWRFVPDGPVIPTTYNYRWYDDATNTLLATTDTLQVCPTTTTTYRLELEIIRGATSTVLTERQTVYVDYSHDEIDLGPDQQMCINDTLTLDATVSNATSYQWYRNGTPIAGATNATYDVTQDGEYVAYAEIGLCSTSDTIQITYFEYPLIDLGNDIIACEGDNVVLDATPSNQTGNETYEWTKDGQIIAGATSNTLTVTETGTYAVTVSNGVCSNTDEIYVYFEPMPNLDIGENQIVCSYETATVSANITDGDSYEWSVNGTVVNTTDTEIQISGTGEYDVVLTMTKGPCTVSDSTHVTVLEPLLIDANPILFGELEVNVSGGLPPYQYALNDGDYQSENYFTGLPDADYTVNVRDENGCEADTLVHVTNLIVPPYMSPNNDGIVDTWRIGNSELAPGSEVYIYDRFGRLVKYMTTDVSESWNGTYNGKAVLSDDYWFVLILKNGKVYKGHFSVIR
jgi:gliding motility-associated-like protein